MTKTQAQISATETDIQEPLQCVWLDDGLPLFYGDDVIERAQAEGYDTFYTIMHTCEKVDHGTWSEKGPATPRLIKVVRNFMCQVLLDVEGDLGSEEIKWRCFFNLPRIPWELIDKMDAFFRAIDEKLKTEAIVMLTYDSRQLESKDPGSGWGIVVPKQTNSAGHCKYEPDSVLDSIPDADQAYIRIVGSAHSHPGMGAFASHVDHDDQDHNDGLHITLGWNHNGPTAFHIEVQVQGETFRYREDQIFAPRSNQTYPELKEWTKRVEKDAPKSSTTHWQGTSNGSYGYGADGFDDLGLFWSANLKNRKFPEGIPSPLEYILFADVLSSDRTCPVCDATITSEDRARRKCYICHTFFMLPDEGPRDILKHRMRTGSHMNAFERRYTSGVKMKMITRDLDEITGEITATISELDIDFTDIAKKD